MLSHKSPHIFTTYELEDNPSAISLSHSSNFFLAVSISINGSAWDLTRSSPLNFRTTYNQYIRFDNGTSIKKKFLVLWAPCNYTMFPSSLQRRSNDILQKNTLNYAYCMTGINMTDRISGVCDPETKGKYPDCITPASFRIQGGYWNDEFDFMQSNLVLCDSKDDTVPYEMKCADTQDVNKILGTSEVQFDMYYSSSLINTQNYTVPNHGCFESAHWSIRPGISKDVNILIEKGTIQDFDDYLWSSKSKNSTFYSIPTSKTKQKDRIKAASNKVFLHLNLHRSSLNTVISRHYISTVDVLIDLGGFSKALMFLGAFFVVGLARYKYSMTIANGLYDFEMKGEPEVKKEEKQETHKEFNFILSGDQSATRGLKQLNRYNSFPSPRVPVPSNKSLLNYAESVKQKKKRLTYDEWSYFKELVGCLCFRKKRDSRLLVAEKARGYASKDLDLLRIIKKLQEFETLKTVVLNHNQKDAFEFIEKPEVTFQGKKCITTQDDSPSPIARMESKKLEKLVSRFNTITTNKSFNGNFIKDDIEEEAADMSNLGNYGELYVAFKQIQRDKTPENRLSNRKLIGMVSPELRKVFNRVDQLLDEEEPSVKQYEYIVEQILKIHEDFI